MIVKRSIILLLCQISLVSAISNTTYVILLHEEHKIRLLYTSDSADE